MRKLPNLRAASALMLATVAICHAQAPPAPGGGRGPGLRLPQQGFEATGQVPANYTPEEAAAVAVVRKWIETSNAHDVAAHMALIDDNIVHRGDPTEDLAHGARSYCQAFGFVRSATSVLRIDELYVVGGPAETLVLLKRTDINNPAGNGPAGGLSGYPVPLAVLVRVKNGKVTEWLDAPINKVSVAPMRAAGALPNFAQPAQTAQPRPVPEVCMKYPEGSK